MTQGDFNNRIRLGESFLLAADNEFIGKLSTNIYDYESISNPYGMYGSIYGAKSVWNPYGIYGSIYSRLSPSNPYSVNPPKIYLHGMFWGYLTCNNSKIGNIVSPQNINQWMINNYL